MIISHLRDVFMATAALTFFAGALLLNSTSAAEWTPIQPLNSYAFDDNGGGPLPVLIDQTADVSVNGNNMVAVWAGAVPQYQPVPDIFVSTSNGAGVHWTTAKTINSGIREQYPYPQVFSIDADRWLIAWISQSSQNAPTGSYDEASVSIDGGKTWSTPTAFLAYKHSVGSSHYRTFVMGSNNNGTLIKAVPTILSNTSGLSRSTNGIDWEYPVFVPVPVLSHVVHLAGSNWFAIDTTTRQALRSQDNGSTWHSLGAVNIPIEGLELTSFQFNTDDPLVAVFSVSSGSSTDAISSGTTYASYSRDGGATWSPREIVHTRSEHSSYWMNFNLAGSHIVSLGSNKWAVFLRHYFTARTVPLDKNNLITNKLFVSYSMDNATTWTAAEELTTSPGWNLPDYPQIGLQHNKLVEKFAGSDKAIVYTFNAKSISIGGSNTGSDCDNFIRTMVLAPAAASDWELYE